MSKTAAPNQVRASVYARYPMLKEHVKRAADRIAEKTASHTPEPTEAQRAAAMLESLGYPLSKTAAAAAEPKVALGRMGDFTQRMRKQAMAELATKERKLASLEPSETDNLAAAVALGTVLAEQDLLGLRKEAMLSAVRLMVKGAQDVGGGEQTSSPGVEVVDSQPEAPAQPDPQTEQLQLAVQQERQPQLPGSIVGGSYYPAALPPPAPTEEMVAQASLYQTAMTAEQERVFNSLTKMGMNKQALSLSDLQQFATETVPAAGADAYSKVRELALQNPEIAGALAGGALGAGTGALAAGEGRRGKGALTGGVIGGLGGLAAGHAFGRHRGGGGQAAKSAPAAAARAPRAAAPRTPVAGPSLGDVYERAAQRAEGATSAQQAAAVRELEEIARRAELAEAARRAQGAAEFSQIGERAQQADQLSRALQGQRDVGAQLAEFLAQRGR